MTDAMRRKTGEQNRNGGAGALPLMSKIFAYDANGRLVEEDRATGFDGSGNPTGWQRWLTAYTPTGKVAATTDPLGNAVRTLYDAMDRPSQITYASGRVTGKTYDLAGQELVEMRGVGSPARQNWATFTWWPDGQKKSIKDANANRITLAYDGRRQVGLDQCENSVCRRSPGLEEEQPPQHAEHHAAGGEDRQAVDDIVVSDVDEAVSGAQGDVGPGQVQGKSIDPLGHVEH